MKALAYTSAILLFAMIYFLGVVLVGSAVSLGIDLLTWIQLTIGNPPPGWWMKNVIPVMMYAAIGSLSASIAGSLVAFLFRSLDPMKVAIAFVVLLIIQWSVNGLLIMLGYGGERSDVYGFVMAIAAVITILSNTRSRPSDARQAESL